MLDKIIGVIVGLITCIVILSVMVGFFVGLDGLLNGSRCKAKAQMQNLEYSYSVVSGCMVKINDSWIDYSRLRYTDLENKDD